MKRVTIYLIVLFPHLLSAFQADSLVANQLFSEGDSLLSRGQFVMAGTKFQTASEIYKNLGLWEKNIASENKRAETLWRINDLSGAQSLSETIIELIHEHLAKDHLQLAFAYKNLGIISTIKGGGADTQEYYLKSLDIMLHTLGTNSLEVAAIYNALGILNSQLLNYRQALEYYTQSLDIRRQYYDADDPGLLGSYVNLAYLYSQLLDFEKGLDYSSSAVLIGEKTFGEHHPQLIQIYNVHGIISEALNDHKQALKYYRKALNLSRTNFGENSVFVGNMLNNIGLSLREMGAFPEALQSFREALNTYLKSNGKENVFFPNTTQNVGSIFLDMRQPDSAFHYFSMANELFKNFLGEKHTETATSYRYMSEARAMQSRFSDALELSQKALISNSIRFSSETIGANPNSDDCQDVTELMETLSTKAHNLYLWYKEEPELERLLLSIETYKSVDSVIENFRENSFRYTDKIQFGDLTSLVYTRAVEICNELLIRTRDTNYQNLAFYFSEKNKASALLSKISGRKIKNFSGVPEELLSLEKKLKSDRSYQLSEVKKALTNDDGYDTTALIEERNALNETNTQLDSIRALLRREYAHYSNLQKSNLKSVTEIQSSLQAELAYVEYLETTDSFYVFILGREIFESLRLSKESVNEKIAEFIQILNTAPNDAHQSLTQFKEVSSFLYQQLMEQVLLFIPEEVEHLVIIPTNQLSLFPFELLIRDQSESLGNKDFKDLQYLLRDYGFSYASSVNASIQADYSGGSDFGTMLAIAPSYDSTSNSISNLRSFFREEFGLLKWNTTELEHIDQFFEGDYLTGSLGTESAFKNSAEKSQIIHLAMHAFVDHEDPMESKLVFYQDNDTIEDGMLHAYELFEMDLSAEMTVLSACETGLGKIQNGEGLMSLGKAFAYAGCPSVITSHWSVDDESTSQLMAFFYRNISKGMPKDHAMQQAKIEFLGENHGLKTHPFYWGAFVVIGDMRPISTKSMGYIWVLLAMVVGGLIIWRRRKF